MKPRKVAIAFLLLIYPLLLATTAVRTTKPNGTTAWTTATDDLTASTLNGDIDNILNVINGNIDNNNIVSSAGIGWTKINSTSQIADASISPTAAIELSKLDGFSDSETELETTFVAAVATPPTTLVAEVEALRLAVQKLNGATTQTTSATQDMEWYLNPSRGPNLLYNGDFEDSIDGSISAAPSGWAFTDATGQYTTPDTDTSEGRGHSFTASLDVVPDGNDDGLTQSLVGLKASTYYLGVVRAKASNSGRCQMITTGGTTNLAATTLSTSYVTLVDILQVTAGAATIAFTLTTDDDSAGTDKCDFDHAALYEMNGDAIPKPEYLPVYTEANGAGAIENDYLTDLLTASVTVPGPGYVIKVSADVCAQSGSAARALLRSQINESVNGGAAAEVIERQGGGAVSAGVMDSQVSLHLEYFKPTSAITSGASYRYTLLASDDNNGMTFTQGGDDDCGTIDQQLLVELVKVQ